MLINWHMLCPVMLNRITSNANSNLINYYHITISWEVLLTCQVLLEFVLIREFHSSHEPLLFILPWHCSLLPHFVFCFFLSPNFLIQKCNSKSRLSVSSQSDTICIGVCHNPMFIYSFLKICISLVFSLSISKFCKSLPCVLHKEHVGTGSPYSQQKKCLVECGISNKYFHQSLIPLPIHWDFFLTPSQAWN